MSQTDGDLHFLSGIHELKGHLSNDKDFQRIMNFMYLESEEEVALGSTVLESRRSRVRALSSLFLDHPNVHCYLAWWDHKVQNKWILPALIKCLSKIPPEDWDRVPSTTNVGGGQHHWTNINTGIQHSLLEAILTYISIRFYQAIPSLLKTF